MDSPLDKRFFNLIKHIHNNDEYMEEALYELVESVHFGRPSIFYNTRWYKLVQLVDSKASDMRLKTKETWNMLVSSALLLSIMEMDDSRFESLYNTAITNVPIDREESKLYRLIRNLVANEIQKELLDGNTMYEYTHREIEWPDISNDEDDYGPDYDMFPADIDVESMAFDNIILEEIKGMLTEREWEILMSEHGDGPMLAKKYGTTEGNIHQLKHRAISKVQEHFCQE